VFVTGGGTLAERIPNGSIRYWSGPAVSTSGNGPYTPGQPTGAQAVALNVQRTAFTRSALSGSGNCTWNPHVRVNAPAAAIAGTYTGTVTHTVV
jgi:hypothetical protein